MDMRQVEAARNMWTEICDEMEEDKWTPFEHRAQDGVHLLYGEISFDLLARSVGSRSPRSGVFVDIGAGRGCACLAAALLGFEECVGLEYVSERATCAREFLSRAKRKLGGDVAATRFQVDCCDALQDLEVYGRADVVLCAATAFDVHSMQRLAAVLARACKPTAVVVTTLKRIPSVRFRVADRLVEPCSWGLTPVLVHVVDSQGASAEFVAACRSQLEAAGIPSELGPVVAQRIVEQDFDATVEWVQLVRVEGSHRTFARAKRAIQRHETCWLVDHAFTWSSRSDALIAVDQVDGLRDRLRSLLEIVESDHETLVSTLIGHPLAGSYRVQDGDRDEVFCFVPDELGAAAARGAWNPPYAEPHPSVDYNCALAPVFDSEHRLAFSILWPIRAIAEGSLIVAEIRGHGVDVQRSESAENPSELAASLLETGSSNREILDYALRPALERAMRDSKPAT